MANKNYEEEDVVHRLRKKQDLYIHGKQIQHLENGKGDVGIGSRGKIDFLVKYCGFVHMYVDEFKRW